MENGQVSEQGTYEELTQPGTRFNLLVRSQLLSPAPALLDTVIDAAEVVA
jgi:hypothetical protein